MAIGGGSSLDTEINPYFLVKTEISGSKGKAQRNVFWLH